MRELRFAGLNGPFFVKISKIVAKRFFFKEVLAVLLLLFLAGCNGERGIILATTTSTQDSGLLDQLLPAFEKKYRLKVKTIAVGTGEAIKMGERGEADVLLVHSAEAEKKFVSQGYGLKRIPVMHNDFVLVGFQSDPADVKKAKSVAEAFRKIYLKKATFISRGDDSGTHQKEKEIWQKIRIKPRASWYVETGQGMGETLRIANEKSAYTLADRGTFLFQKKRLNLKILFQRDEILLNSYSVIAVNSEKFPQINKEDAEKFIKFLISTQAQKIIRDFGKDEFGQPLFFPDAKR